MNQAPLLVGLVAAIMAFMVNVEAASKPCDEDVLVPGAHPSMDFKQMCKWGCAKEGMVYVPQKAPIFWGGMGKVECCCALIPGTYAYKVKYDNNSDKKRGYDDDDEDDDSAHKKSKYRGYGENKRGHDDDGEGSSQKKSRWFQG